MEAFDQTWRTIETLQGETFHQKGGKPFTYTVRGSSVHLQTTNQALPRSLFERAYARLPVPGPAALNDLRGPSYLYAILNDPRVQ